MSSLLLSLVVLYLINTVKASPPPPASLYGTVLNNLTIPYEHDAFVQLAAPKKVPFHPPPFPSAAEDGWMSPPFLLATDLIIPITQLALKSPITRNGSFAFAHLEQGDYVLSVHSRRAQFQLYAVSVLPSSQVDVRLYLPGVGAVSRTKPFPHPLQIPILHLTNYSDLATPFSFLHLLKANPTLVLGLLALVCLAGLPKLLARLDPETALEVNKSQAEMHAKLVGLTSSLTGTNPSGGGGGGLTESLSKRLAKTGGAGIEKDGDKEPAELQTGTSSKVPTTTSQGTPGKGNKGGKKRK